MHHITTPIKADDKEAVSNLQSALVFLLRKQRLELTADELNEIQKQWQQEQQEAYFGKATTKLVAIFQKKYKVKDNSGIVDEETANRLNQQLKNLEAFEEPVQSFLVKGTINYDNGKPCSGAVVRAYDVDLRRQEPLGNVTTDANGYYEIAYNKQQFTNAEKDNADLCIAVFNTELEVKALKASEVFYNANDLQEINLSIPATPEVQVSEWEMIDVQLKPLLKDQYSLPQALNVYRDLLPEELHESDFEFLSKDTGIDKRNIELWSLAYKSSAVTDGVEEKVFYGWFRMDLPTNIEQLWKQPFNNLLESLKNAVEKNIIPAFEKNGLDKIKAQIDKIKIDAIIIPSLEGQPANLGTIISAASVNGEKWLSNEKMQQLAAIHAELDPDAKDFTDKIAHIDFTPSEQTKLQQTLRLDKLTQNNPALINGLQRFVAKDQDASLKSLASLQPDEWIDLAYQHGTPAGAFIEPEVYAKQMEMALEERLPTATLVNKINTGFLFQDQPSIVEIAKKLEFNTSFDIASDDVKKIGLDEEQNVFVQKIQNLKKLGATWDEAEVLLNNGLTNVAKLAEYNSDQIKNIVGDDIDISRVKAIHENVKTQQAIGIGLMAFTQGVFSGPSAAVMAPKKSSKSKIDTEPTLRNLFGALEQCDCDPCMSVLSPAAYYADLLKFIDSSPKPKGNDTTLSNAHKQDPRIILEERRPDLYDLELSCDNANIVLPHIDLVLEILENAVMFSKENPKEFSLPVGVDAELQFKTPIGEEVAKVFQSTSEDTLKALSAKRFSALTKYPPNISFWIVTDRYRRWIVRSQKEAFVSGNKILTASVIDFDVPQMIKCLNSNGNDKTIDAVFSSPIIHLINNYNRQKTYSTHFDLKYSFSVDTIDAGKKWKINFTSLAHLEFTDDGNSLKTLIVKSENGEVLMERKFHKNTTDGAEKQLAAGEKPAILLGKGENKHLKIESATQGGYLIREGNSFELVYTEPSLAITGLTYQSTTKDRDLLTRAQNKNPLAYGELAKASSVFPWSLPYDVYLTELRILLNKAGLPRLNLINTHLSNDKKYTDAIWARELLGLSVGQQEIITKTFVAGTDSSDKIFTAWGLRKVLGFYVVLDKFTDDYARSELGCEVLRRSSIIMQQANISFSDVQYLNSTLFINSSTTKVNLLFDEFCNPSNMILENSDENYFDRFHRFVRLWRITSLSISELDQAIMADGIGDKVINDSTILHIAQLKTLQQKLNIPFQTAIDFFTPFKNESSISFNNGKRIESKSLYNKIFRNIHLQNPANPDFKFDTYRNKTTVTKAEYLVGLPYIATCLGLRLSDLNQLIDLVDINIDLENNDPNAIPSKHPSNIDYLYSLWRNISLANILQLTILEYAAARNLINNSVSVFTSPETLLNFCDEVAFVKKSGIVFEQLESILTGKDDSSKVTTEFADINFAGLKTELEKCKDYFFREKLLTIEMLETPAFAIPKTKELTWERWGLTYNASTEKWSVEIGADTISEKDPMDILSIAPFLSILCNTSLGQINSALGSNFVTGGSGVPLFEITDAATKDWKIINLEPSHLKRLKLFLELGRVLGHDAWDLDELLTSFFGKNIQPDKDALTLFIKANTEILQQRRQSVVTFLSKTYEMAEEAVLQLLKEKLTVSYKSESVSALELLIDNGIRQNPIGNNLSEPIKKVLIALQKISTLNSFWKANSAELKWLRKSSSTTGYLGIVPDDLQSASISYIDWKQSTLLFSLVQSNKATEKVLNDYLEKIGDAKTRKQVTQARTEVFVPAFGLYINDVNDAAVCQGMDARDTNGNLIDPPLVNNQLNPIRILSLFNYLSDLQQSGLSANELESLIAESASIGAVQLARKLLYVRYGKDFAAALQEVNNKLRIEQRDRLVDYLCWRDGLRNANALYEKYLIDVEMQPCMKTTRLLQATAAAQLFVYRCLMNLEDKVSPESFDKKRWEWTQNYRVWEANRRVFLYPENWLYPELRDDKSDAFKKLENVLTQNEPSYEKGVLGMRQYLDDLSDVTQIVVVAMHTQTKVVENMPNDNTFYQVGRSANVPYSYYSRKCTQFGSPGMRWSGWEKLEVDISSDHIVLFVREGDLHIAWALLTEVHTDGSFQFQMAWMRQQSMGWTSKKTTSNEPLKLTGIPGRDISKQMYLDVNYNSIEGNPDIFCYVADNPIKLTTNPPTVGTEITQVWDYKDAGLPLKPNFQPMIISDKKCRIAVSANIIIKYIYPGDSNKNYFDTLSANEWTLTFQLISNSLNTTNTATVSSWQSWKYIDLDSEQEKGVNATKTYYINLTITARGITKVYSNAFNGTISLTNGAIYEIIINKMLDANTPPQNSVENSGPASMKLWSKFKFNDLGEAGLYTSTDDHGGNYDSDLPLFPLKTLANNSAFTEISNSDDGAKVNISNSTISIIERSESGRFTIRKASQNMPPDRINTVWYVTENQNAFLTQSPIDGNMPFKVLPASYGEALLFKRAFIKGTKELFNETQREKNSTNDVFAMTAVLKYFNNTTIDPKDPSQITDPAYDLRLPNAFYNWELFYHSPVSIAYFLFKRNRFDEARKWFHFIFDPTTNDSETGANRFWTFLPFRKNNEIERADKLLDILAEPDLETDDDKRKLIEGRKQIVKDQIAAWLADPFNPFAVARMRIGAFEWFTVNSYINNLIAWGDQLFRRDTRESINEATILYVMASNILGRRKEKMGGRQNDLSPKSYRSLNSGDKLDAFANKWVAFSQIGLDQDIQQVYTRLPAKNDLDQLASIGSTYFCVPPNDKITQLWDDVDDRLFKIRNCQNIDGVVRNLPLLDPPIDPEILIRAKAAGLSISDALGYMYAPLPLYRFNVMQQKAMELCNEVKALGSAMLSAIEKKDAEHLSLLRSGQEIEMLKLVEWIKNEQINEAAANIESIHKSRENIVARIMYLQKQMGVNEINFDASGVPVIDQSFITQVQATGAPNDFKSLALIGSEVEQVNWMQAHHTYSMLGSSFKSGGAALTNIAALLPAVANERLKVLGEAASVTGDFFSLLAMNQAEWEKRSGLIASWQRRRDEWLYQAKTAVLEIKQLDKQIIASEIRKAISEKELENHHKQIEHSSNLDEFVRKQKFSSETLYTWMESQLSNVYNAAYQMALDQAKKAEKAYRFELGDEESPKFIQPGYWDSLRKGLLAGEGLTQDLRRMEIAYLEKNKREFEITKHISLVTLNASAIIDLRRDGICNFQIPELLFEMDFPGHYFRRIKSVSISIPCIAGPYTSVSSQLSLSKSYIRKDDKNGSVIFDSSNESFKESYSSIKSIATSNALGDSGMFELNFRDERYLPFEGAGVISDWELELPKEARQFDYNTISDVIITIRYTARNSGSSLFKDSVNTKIKEQINQAVSSLNENEGLYRLISLKNDFPDIFYAMKAEKGVLAPKEITIEKSFFPYFTNSFDINFTNSDVSFYKKDGNRISPGIVIDLKDQSIKSIESITCESLSSGLGNKALLLVFNPSFLTSDEIGSDDILILINYKLEKSKPEIT